MEKPEKLAESGWSEDQIKLLEQEIELAKQKAKAEAYNKGYTFETQQRKIREAEKQARKVAHERMHAEMEAALQEIKALGEAKELPVEAKSFVKHFALNINMNGAKS